MKYCSNSGGIGGGSWDSVLDGSVADNLPSRLLRVECLLSKSREQLVVEESQWKQMAEAVARVMWPAAKEG
jgi:hypothetical protein